MNTQQSFWQQYFLSVAVLVLALAALAAALSLQLTGNDATNAWAAFGGFAVLFTGIHIPSPIAQTNTTS